VAYKRKAFQTVYVSATPADYELEKSNGVIVEQLIRPTGLLDPVIEVRPARHQVDDLVEEVRKVVARGERVLVTTLTKRMAEELTAYLKEIGIGARYLHSDIHTVERVELIRDLRSGVFDVLVGVNLLREGLDLPEVSLVAILDADKEGFLRSERSLIQTCGRAARNAGGRVLMYADAPTGSMLRCLEETARRRAVQEEYNREHGITPKTVKKSLRSLLDDLSASGEREQAKAAEEELEYQDGRALRKEIEALRKEMFQEAERLNFEKAAELRDRLLKLEKRELQLR